MTINTARSQASVKEPTAVYVGALGLAAILAGCCLAYAVLLRYGMTGWEEAFGTSSYRGAAERWIETGTSTNNRPPAYPTLLAVNAWLWGVSAYVPAVVVIQALTAWGTLMALFLLARRSTGSAAWGLIAVTVVCLNLLWVHEAVRNREAFLYSALLVALVGAMVHLRPQSVLYGVAVGGCCAIGWLTRPPGIVLLPAVLFCTWKDSRRTGFRLGGRAAVALTVSFSLPVLTWVALQTAGQPVATSGRSNASNLLKGNNRALMEIYPFIDVDRLEPGLVRPLREAASRKVATGAWNAIARPSDSFGSRPGKL